MSRSENLEKSLGVMAEHIGVTRNPDDPSGFDPLPEDRWSKPVVHHPYCYICNDPDFMTHGLPLCFPCVLCGGHVAADDYICDLCGAVQPTDPEEAKEPEGIQITGVELVRSENDVFNPTRLKICIVDARLGIGYEKTLCGESWDREDGEDGSAGDMNTGLYKYPTCYKCSREYWRRINE